MTFFYNYTTSRLKAGKTPYFLIAGIYTRLPEKIGRVSLHTFSPILYHISNSDLQSALEEQFPVLDL